MNIGRGVVCMTLVVVLLVAGASSAQGDWPDIAPGETVIVTLTNGDVLHGVLTSLEDDSLIIEHPLLGSVVIQQQSIRTVELASTDPAFVEQGASDPSAEDAEEPLKEIVDAEPKPWDFAIDIGLTGSGGNTDKANARLRFGATFMSELREFDAYGLYLYSEEDGDRTQSRAELSARNEWLMPDRHWRYFVRGLLEFDEERSFDLRFSGNTGVGYDFISNDMLQLIGRAGVGASREWGSDNTDVVPEGFLGLDLRWAIDERQSFVATVEYYPSFEDTRDFRARFIAAYEVQLDDTGHLYLKAGIEDRYDEVVDQGIDRNDIDYFLTLSYKF